MNRRDLFKVLSAGTAAAIVRPTLAGPITMLTPRQIGASSFVVSGDKDGRVFSMTLYRKPWPVLNERIGFEYEGLSFIGRVTYFQTRQDEWHSRTFYEISGEVEQYDAPAIMDRDA